MSQTITLQQGFSWRQNFRLYSLGILFLLSGFIGLHAQNVTWDDSKTLAGDVNIGSSRPGKLEFYFYPSATVSSAQLVITLPANDTYDIANPALPLSGSVDLGTPVLSNGNRTVTFNDVTLTAGQVVYYRISHTATTSVPTTTLTGSATVELKKTGITGGLKTFNYAYKWAAILITAPPAQPNQTGFTLVYGDNDGMHSPGSNTPQTFSSILNCSNASVDSITVSVSLLASAGEFSNWKVNGAAIPTSQITSVIGTTYPYQVTFTIGLSKVNLPGGNGFDSGERTPLTVDIKKNACGSTPMSLVGFLAGTVSAPYKPSNTIAASLSANPGIAGSPNLQITQSPAVNRAGMICMDGSTNLLTTKVTNNGNSPAYGIVYTLNVPGIADYVSYLDTNAIRYKIGSNGTWVVPQASQIRVTSRKPLYTEPLTNQVSGILLEYLEPLAPKDTIYTEFGVIIPNDGKKIAPRVDYDSYNFSYGSHAYSWSDQCRTQSLSLQLVSFYPFENIAYLQKSELIALSMKSGESKSLDPVQLNFNAFNPVTAALRIRNNNSKYVLRVMLPPGIKLDDTDPVLWKLMSDETKIFAPSNPTQTVRNDTTFYTFDFVYINYPSKYAVNPYQGRLYLKYKALCPGVADLQAQAIISVDYYPNGPDACNQVIFSSAVEAKQDIKLLCDLQGYSYNFSMLRKNIGLADSDDDGIADLPLAPADISKIDHTQLLPNDTASVIFDGKVIGTGNKKVYAVLYSAVNQTLYSLLNANPLVTFNAISNPASLTITPDSRNPLISGVPRPFDRGTGVDPTQRYAYTWEISKSDGTNFTNGDLLKMEIPFRAADTINVSQDILYAKLTSYGYTTTASIPDALNPGTSAIGTEQYTITTGYLRTYIVSYSPGYVYNGVETKIIGQYPTIYGIPVGSFSPYEFRHLSTVDSLVVTVSKGYIISNENTFMFRRYKGTSGVFEDLPRVVTASPINNTDTTKTFILGPEVFDVNHNDASKIPLPDGIWNVFPQFKITSTNNSPPTANYKVYLYTDIHSYTQSNIPRMKRPSLRDPALISTAVLSYTDPGSVKINMVDNPIQNALSSTVKWAMNIQNTKPSGDAVDVWLYAQGPVSNVSFKDAANNTYTGVGEGGRWIHIPRIVAATFLSGNFSVSYSSVNCSDQTVLLYPMFDRINTTENTWMPFGATSTADLTDAIFDQTKEYVYSSQKLTIKNLPANISGGITPLASTLSNPANPASAAYGISTVAVGTPFPVEMLFSSSASLGSSVNSYITAVFPRGLKYVDGSAYLYNPSTGVNKALSGEVINTVLGGLTGGTSPVNLDLKLLDAGVPNGEITSNGEYLLRFQLEASCNINLTPERIVSKIYGEQPCDGPASGSGAYTYSSGYMTLTGTTKAYNALFDITSDKTSFSCRSTDAQSAAISLRFKLQETPSTVPGPVDSLRIVIPKSLNLSGSISYSLPANSSNSVPAQTGNVSAGSITNIVDGDLRYISWPMPYAYFQALAAQNSAYQNTDNVYNMNLSFISAGSDPFSGNIHGAIRADGAAASSSCPSIYADAVAKDVSITVFGTPIVTDPSDIVVCSNSVVPQISFAGNYTDAGYGYSWAVLAADQVTATEIGMSSTSGTSTIPTFTAVNNSASVKTVHVEVTPTFGDCSGTVQSFTITVNPKPTFTVTPQTICSGSSYTLSSAVTAISAGATVKYYTANDGSGELTGPALTVSPTTTTTYYARATVTSSGCTGDYIPIVLTVNPLPAFTLSSTTASFCSGAGFDLSTLLSGPVSNGSLFYYSDVACTTTAANPVTSPGIYYLRAENINTGCKSEAQSVTVSLKTPTSISLQPVGASTCAGTNITMSVTAAGDGTLSYQWKKDGSIVGGATASSYSTSIPGSYTVDVTGTCGTLTSSAAMITAKAVTAITTQPTPSITVCQGGATTLSVVATAEGTPTYQWYNVGGEIAGATGSTYTPTISGTYHLVVTGSCGTAISNNSVVTINPLPVPTITGASSAAQNHSGVTYFTESGKSNYFWTIGGGTITSGQNTANITVTWGAGSTGSLTVTYQSGGCSPIAPTSKTVTLGSQDVPVITLGSSSVCPNEVAGYSTESGKYNYTWTVVGGTIQSGQGTNNISVLWNGSGASSVAVEYRHGSDTGLPLVDASESITRKVATIITADPVGGTVCFGNDIPMSVSVTCEGPATYVWKQNGTVVGGNTANYSATASGNYTVDVTAACGTATSAVAAVTVKSQPVATISGLTAAVTTQQVTYTAGAGSNYNWNVVNGTIISGGTSSDNTVTVAWSTAGTGSVGVNYTDNGCPTTTATTTVTITAQSTPTLESPVTSVCYNSLQSYTTQSGKFNYLWTVTGGTISGANNTATVSVIWGAAGTGTIRVAYSEALAATVVSSEITNVTINDNPLIDAIVAPAGVCDGSALDLTTPSVTSTTSLTAQEWKLNDLAFTSGSTVTYAQNGQTLYYEAINACGTSISNTTTITVYQLPTITTTDQSICPAVSINLATAVTNPMGYSLLFYTVPTGGTALSSSVVTPTVTTTYYVEALNSNGCANATRVPLVITLKTATAITIQPEAPVDLALGDPFNLSVTAEGENLTYQWYKGGSAITTNSTAQSATYSVASATSSDYGSYYVVVSGDCGSPVTSATVSVGGLSDDATLKNLQVNGVTIPGFDPLIIGYNYTISCDVTTATIVGTPNNANATVTAIPTVTLNPGDNYYNLKVTAEDGITTKTYSINIVRDCYVPKITKDLEDAVICVGDNHTFEIQAEGINLTYEWYYGLNRIVGANTNTYTISNAVLGDYERYQVIVRSNFNGFQSSAYSRKARLWVADYLPNTLKFAEYPNPAITGQTYHIKVDGYVDVTKYTWNYSKEGVTFSPEVGSRDQNETWATFGTLSAGNGTLKVTMEHPCGTRELTQAITVKYPTGTDDVTATAVQVYPNPTSGILKVSGTEMNQQIRVLDVAGSLKGTYKTIEGTTTIDLTGYAKGTYMVQYNGKTYKVIKN